MEMTLKAEQAHSMAYKAKAELHCQAMKEAEKCIRQRVQGKIALRAQEGATSCVITYFSHEEEVYKCVGKILEENGYHVEKLPLKVLALGVRW